MHHLYDTTTQRITWSGAEPYTVDGKPGVLPPNVIEITDAEDTKPDVQSGKVLVAAVTIDTESRQRRTTWTLADAPLVPITKLTLKRRVTPTEWETITGAIAQDADTFENWNLATEIDPAHPETSGMIAALTGAGLLTTPLHVIFAP